MRGRKNCYSTTPILKLRLDSLYIDSLLKAQPFGTQMPVIFSEFSTADAYPKTQHAICMLANMHFTCILTTEQNQSKSNASGVAALVASFFRISFQLPCLTAPPATWWSMQSLPERLPQTATYVSTAHAPASQHVTQYLYARLPQYAHLCCSLLHM